MTHAYLESLSWETQLSQSDAMLLAEMANSPQERCGNCRRSGNRDWLDYHVCHGLELDYRFPECPPRKYLRPWLIPIYGARFRLESDALAYAWEQGLLKWASGKPLWDGYRG